MTPVARSNYSARRTRSLRSLLLWPATALLLMAVSPESSAFYMPQYVACVAEPYQKPPDVGGCRGT